jgi:HSP20 family molecular chaperone IbpA
MSSYLVERSFGSFALNITDNLLTIRGEKKSERDEKNKDYHRSNCPRE